MLSNIFGDLLDSIIIDVSSECHRIARLGLDCNLEEEEEELRLFTQAQAQAQARVAYPSNNGASNDTRVTDIRSNLLSKRLGLDCNLEEEEEELRLSTQAQARVADPSNNGDSNTKCILDIFGQTHPAVASEIFECMNCGRSTVAGRGDLSVVCVLGFCQITVTLSKTKKKGREHKETIVNSIRDAIEKYNSVYVFSFENMRNLKFKEFREQLKTSSRFFLGSNKVMQIALGKTDSDEIRTGIHKVSKLLHGDAGLCLTNLPKEEVERLFGEYEEHDFGRTGSTSTEKVELNEGPLDQFSHEMEPFLRKQGMPVRLNKGVIELVSDFVVCEEGKPLSPEASRILRLLGVKMATFRLQLIARWSPDEFESYKGGMEQSDSESS
ncbi:hypothetical protein GIB67_017112 [Kingdonia uniflora]|uniref:Ribosome assembly factor mrt4 n=1 Tax=Kingdonia uniflora TaxID=39325 RepID=A0A7J7NCC2_9MAGN|nr:hypothetical protein GIB67_017112 [Kingdonia uniflora]